MKITLAAISLGTPMCRECSVNHRVTKWICSLVSLAMLVGCGGGGDEPSGSGGTYYGVTGVKNGSFTTICLDNAVYIDPNSDNGKNVTQQIASFYGLSGGITTLSGTGQSCADKFPLASPIITVDYYNNVVLVAGSSGGAGSPSPTTPPITVGEPAMQCLQISRPGSSNWAQMTNICAHTISVSWCYAGNGGDCRNGTWGYSNTGNIAAGGTRPAGTLVSGAGQYGLAYAACKGRDVIIQETGPKTFVCQ